MFPNVLAVRCATFWDVRFSVPESRRFPAPRKRDDSSVAGVASVTLLEELAVFLVVMQAWPCRSVVKTMKMKKMWNDNDHLLLCPVARDVVHLICWQRVWTSGQGFINVCLLFL